MASTEAHLSSPTDIAGFRTEARQLLAHQVPPDEVTWSAQQAGILASTPPQGFGEESRQRGTARAASSIVPASFVRLCEYVVQHRDPERFALLYRLLWRLVHEPGLRHDNSDPDMARAHHMAHAVRRDIHKLKTHLRFRSLPDPQQPGQSMNMAWCEPSHHVVETIAPWFAKRHGPVRWTLFTPERIVFWDGRQLHYALGCSPLSSTSTDADWVSRWQAAFAKKDPLQ